MADVTKNKEWHEATARFFENPSRESLRDLLKTHAGEFNNCDFKGDWPAFPKVARHVLGFANSGGGCMIVGVEEHEDNTFEPAGINKLVDKADFHKGIQKFIPGQLKYEVLDFSFEDSEYPKIVGKRFQIVLVEDSPEYIPFVSRSGSEGIRETAIYVRRGTSSEEANYEELQEILNRRLGTGYSSKNEFDLAKHLAELETLYKNIPKYHSLFEGYIGLVSYRNPDYPQEGFEAFVKRVIDEKKEIILKIVRNAG